MARLPDYTALGETPTPQAAGGIASFTPTDTSGAGRQISAAGRDLEDASNIVMETNLRQDTMVAEAAFNQLQAKRLDLEAGDGGFKSVKGSGVVGPQFVQDYTKKFADASKDIEQTLTNDNQRKLYAQRTPIALNQYRGALLSHQAAQTDVFNEQTENNTIDLARRQIFTSPTDPQAIDAGMAQINWAIDQKARRMGWDPVVATEAKRKYAEKVFEDSAAMLVERDPMAALSAIDKRMGVGGEGGPSGITAIDGINVGELVKLRHRAASYVEQASNKLKAEGERRLKDAEHETKQLQEFALTGTMVSPAYEQQVLGKVAGTQFEAPARQIIAASYAGATHGSQPLPQQEQRLRVMDATVAAGGASPDEAKLVQRAREITNTQREAYKENPWAAATRFGHQTPVEEQPISDPSQVPKLVANRLPLMTGVEVFSGQPVSPLQPAEAKAFVDKLGGLPPDAKAEVLGQTGAMLSAPRATALADQLDKHDKPLALALKMGLDRSIAGRASSSWLLLGAQALSDKTVKKDDSALAGWRADIATEVRGTLGDPKVEQDVIDASYYIRAFLELPGGAAAGFVNAGSANTANAIGAVIGKPLERAGVKTFMPRGMASEGEFDTKLRAAYTPEKLREMAPGGEVFVRGRPVKVEQLANRITQYGLRYAGQGKYVPVANNAPFTLDAQGTRPLVLEVR